MLTKIIFLIILFLKFYLDIEILKCSLRNITNFREHQSCLLYFTSYALPSNIIILISLLVIEIKVMIEIIHYFISTRLNYFVFYCLFEIPISDLHLRTNIDCSNIKILLFCFRSSSMLEIINQFIFYCVSTISNDIECFFPLIRRKRIKIKIKHFCK